MEAEDLTLKTVTTMLKEYKTTQNAHRKAQLKRVIVLIYMPVVKKIAHSIARRTTDPVEDIIQVGAIGLMKAVDNYETEKNDNFKYYASPYIVGEIKHYLRDYSSMIKAPRALKEISFRIAKITEKLTEENGLPPTDKELAEALQVNESALQEYKNIERRVMVISSDTPCDENGENTTSLIEQVKDEKQELNRKLFEDKLLLDTALKDLSDIEQDLIQLYFYEELNNQEISLRLNIPQRQVSVKLQTALNKMMQALK